MTGYFTAIAKINFQCSQSFVVHAAPFNQPEQNYITFKMVNVPAIKMNNGLIMPGFGLGTFEVSIIYLFT